MSEPRDGFILLHRRIQDHPYWSDPERLRAWLDCLFMAAWRDHRRLLGTHQVEILRGQFIASEPFLASRWRWSRGKVRRFMRSAAEANEIRPCGGTSDGTIYLVVKYDDYQPDRPSDGTGDRTSNGQGADIIELKGKKETTPTYKAVAEFCERTGAAWSIKTPMADWAADLARDSRFSGIDIPFEIRKAREWHEAKHKTPRAPNMALLKWLDKAASDRRTDAGPDGGRPASHGGGQATGTDGRRSGFIIE